ncbi:hypothetical protein [Erythrobacter longus]|nr:hypothetical protein [Erythrobacter longus]
MAIIGQSQQTINAQLVEEFGEEDDFGEFDPSSLPRTGWFIDNDHPQLRASHLGDVLALDYYGPDYGPGWDALLKTLCEPEVARTLGSLRIGGPDQGANGSRIYMFEDVISSDVTFPNLSTLWIRPTDPGDHNCSYLEDGELEAMLSQMPSLQLVTLPQPLDLTKLKTRLEKLEYLECASTYRHYHFITGLAESDLFPALTFLDFGDSWGAWNSLQELAQGDVAATSFADYEKLARSVVGERMRGLRLRNARLSKAEYQKLQAIRPDWQFSVVLAPPHVYVSHWDKTDFPYEHLLVEK